MTSSIINKIKNLLELAKSPNENEASTAKLLAEALIEKYQVNIDDIIKVNSSYDYLLISLTDFSSWVPKLILLIASQFNTNAFQNVNYINNKVQYDYCLDDKGHGDEIKSIFDSLYHLINNYQSDDKQYLNSFCEGIIEGIRFNLITKSVDISVSNIVKDNSVENKVDVNSQSMVVDIVAFIKGMEVGRNIDLKLYFPAIDCDASVVPT
jgi:hypothetical protein